jgi:hypothetical protein
VGFGGNCVPALQLARVVIIPPGSLARPASYSSNNHAITYVLLRTTAVEITYPDGRTVYMGDDGGLTSLLLPA